MKRAVRFSLIQSGIALALVLLIFFLKLLDNERFAASLWLFITNGIIGLVLFAFFGMVTKEIYLSWNATKICYAVLSLVVINVIPFYEERNILTFVLFKGIANRNLDPIVLGIHVLAILSFAIAHAICFQKGEERV